jgi:uncharacterized membrane protein
VNDPPTPPIPAAATRPQQPEVGTRANEQFALVRVQQESFFSGPLPPPELLREYDKIAPGCAQRIIGMAEKEGDHRRAIQKLKVRGGLAARTRGQYLGWSLAVVIAGLGAFLIYEGRELTGFGALILAIAPLATPFLLARAEARQQADIADALRGLIEHDDEGQEGAPDEQKQLQP